MLQALTSRGGSTRAPEQNFGAGAGSSSMSSFQGRRQSGSQGYGGHQRERSDQWHKHQTPAQPMPRGTVVRGVYDMRDVSHWTPHSCWFSANWGLNLYDSLFGKVTTMEIRMTKRQSHPMRGSAKLMHSETQASNIWWVHFLCCDNDW